MTVPSAQLYASTFHVLFFLMSLRGHGFVHSFAKTPYTKSVTDYIFYFRLPVFCILFFVIIILSEGVLEVGGLVLMG